MLRAVVPAPAESANQSVEARAAAASEPVEVRPVAGTTAALCAIAEAWVGPAGGEG